MFLAVLSFSNTEPVLFNISTFVVNVLSRDLGKPPEHFHHPAVFVDRKIDGPLQFFFVQGLPVEVVFQVHLVIVFRVFFGKFCKDLDMETVYLQLHLLYQGDHIEAGASCQGGKHQGLGSVSFSFTPIFRTGIDLQVDSRRIVTFKGHPAYPFGADMICHALFFSFLVMRIN